MTNSLPVSGSNTGESGLQTDDGCVIATKPAGLTSNSNGLNPSATGGHGATMLDSSSGEGGRIDGFVRKKFSKLLKGKEEEWTAVAQKKGPLQLLDLPMDVLKEIVKEVTHTNDLTALALTHSALHNLAIPHIYSRFDIVWPDANSTSDTRTGVDALTYGLSTLVMGQDVFEQPFGTSQRRLGNNYPQFTRKFSLGNGPAEWVQEYMITKESGKMLGTLVALAVARMVNLETFIWDMPTGVLRDVWLALSSLNNKSPPGQCRLERLLVRWHDNSFESSQSSPNGATNSNTTANPPAGSTLTTVGIMVPAGLQTTPQQNAVSPTQNRVEYPTLSVLPPLKSLSVLDIDELAYLDEMSVLIEKSKDCLRELRVGIAKKAVTRDFVLAWDGPDLYQVDHNAKWSGALNTIGERRLGGVLGILLGRVYDIRKKSKMPLQSKHVDSSHTVEPLTSPPSVGVPTAHQESDITYSINSAAAVQGNYDAAINSVPIFGVDIAFPQESAIPSTESVPLGHEIPTENTDGPDMVNVSATITSPGTEFLQPQPAISPPLAYAQIRSTSKEPQHALSKEPAPLERQHLDGRLKLQVLELERVPLSIAVLQKGFDWPMVTSLTILDCAYHESLWKMLRRHYQPQICPRSALATSSIIRQSISANSASKPIPNVPMEYQLNLKKIHTDFASPALIAFLRETLAPNSLEVLFLQDRRRSTPPSISINDIFRGPLKRHRRSLKKLLIDSSDKIPKAPNNANDNMRWKTWMLSHEVLAYVTSGNMTNLRELSIAIEYKDWHFFLRRLPQIPTLRSLNIPFIADHVTPAFDPRELAMQVVDMIFLRPEVELCYLGISNKCFEILENRPNEDSNSSIDPSGNGAAGDQVTDEEDDDDDDDGDASEDDGDEDEDDDEDHGTATEAVEADGVEYETSDPGDSEAESSMGSVEDRSKLSLRLREILFYDDKVAIFKARHMRL